MPKKISKKQQKVPTPKQEVRSKYIEKTGRRKESTARVRLYKKKGQITINERNISDYFTTSRNKKIAESPLVLLSLSNKVSVSSHIKGGGISSQAIAFRHGLSRALVESDKAYREHLKKEGYLKRDSRIKERKKFGLKKARRAPQWSKR